MSIKLQLNSGLPQSLPRSRQSVRLHPISSASVTNGLLSEEDLQLASEVRALPDIVSVVTSTRKSRSLDDGLSSLSHLQNTPDQHFSHEKIFSPKNTSANSDEISIGPSQHTETRDLIQESRFSAPSVTEKLNIRRKERHVTTLKELAFSLEST